MFVWSADWSELSVAILPPLYRPDITTAWIPWTSLCPMMTLLSPLPLGLSCKARYVQNTHPGPCEPHPLWTGNGTLSETVQAVLRSFLECTSDVKCLIVVCFIDSYHISLYCWSWCFFAAVGLYRMDIWFTSSHAVLLVSLFSAVWLVDFETDGTVRGICDSAWVWVAAIIKYVNYE